MNSPTQPDVKAEKSLLTTLAMHICEQSMASSRMLMEEHSATFKWLMASLLALNSGGLFLIKDFFSNDHYFSVLAALAFFIGIFLSLMIAFVGQKSHQKMLPPVNKLAIYWRSVALTGEKNEDLKSRITKEMDEATVLGRWPSRIGFGSFFFFGLGLALAVCAMKTTAETSTPRSQSELNSGIPQTPQASR